MRKYLIPTLAALAFGAGCKIDHEFNFELGEGIAVTAGDFDNVGAPFDRMVLDHEAYEGLISTATWDDTYEPGNVALKAETLFYEDISKFGAVFIASGTRGLGKRQYNGLDPDDQFVSDPDVVERVQSYASRSGNALFLTDWSYDLVEACWPDMVEFLGDDADLDAAQKGEIMSVTAQITEESLAEDLEMEQMAVNFDFSNWAVMEDTHRDVTVWMRADVRYRPTADNVESLAGVPILVSFQPSGADGGRVFLSSFHLDAQTEGVMDELLQSAVGKFKPREVTGEVIQ